jgi:tRNA dimethylallyltransferase
MQSIGYKQLFSYFAGACSLEQAVEQVKMDTRRFAKRQLTWFRRDSRVRWHDVTDYDAVKNALLKDCEKKIIEWMKGNEK